METINKQGAVSLADPSSLPQLNNVEANLINDLLKQYPGSGLARPLGDFNSPYLTVNISMILNDFDDLDDITEMLILSGRVIARWVDANLKWNASLYENVNKVQLRAADVWLPPVIQYNYAPDCATPLFSTGGADSLSTVWVKDNGEVMAIHAGELTTKCSLDLSRFPFDSQTCSYIYTTYAYTFESLHFEPDMIAFVDTPDPSAVWSILKYSCSSTRVGDTQSPDNSYSAVQCDFTLERRSSWFLINFFAPSLLLAVLQLTTFFMPLGEGRAAFCVTVVLAFAVFQTIASTLLPKTSSNIPLVTYLIVQMIVGTVATLDAMFLFYLYESGAKQDKKVPPYLRWVLFVYGTHKDSKELADEKEGFERLCKRITKHGTDLGGLPRRSTTGTGMISGGKLTPADSFMSTVTPGVSGSMFIPGQRVFYSDANKLVGLIALQRLKRLNSSSIEEQWKSIARFFDTIIGFLCFVATIVSICFFFLN